MPQAVDQTAAASSMMARAVMPPSSRPGRGEAAPPHANASQTRAPHRGRSASPIWGDTAAGGAYCGAAPPSGRRPPHAYIPVYIYTADRNGAEPWAGRRSGRPPTPDNTLGARFRPDQRPPVGPLTGTAGGAAGTTRVVHDSCANLIIAHSGPCRSSWDPPWGRMATTNVLGHGTVEPARQPQPPKRPGPHFHPMRQWRRACNPEVPQAPS